MKVQDAVLAVLKGQGSLEDVETALNEGSHFAQCTQERCLPYILPHLKAHWLIDAYYIGMCSFFLFSNSPMFRHHWFKKGINLR